MRRVFLVEDDDGLRELVRVALSEAGYVVECAPDGATALRVLETRAHEMHAVVLDLMLPDFPGRIVLLRAKQLRRDLPIIVATGSHDVAEVEGEGADVLIHKPYGPRDVVAALDALTIHAV